MKAGYWTTWERHMPMAKVETRTGAAVICMKPWDQILPEEGVEERMASTQPLWRTWERYLPGEGAKAAMHLLSETGAEKMEKVHV